MRLFDVSPNFPIIEKETKGDYYKHGYELTLELPNYLPHVLPKDLGSWDLRKNQENLKTCENYKLVPSLPAKMIFVSILNFSRMGAISHEN